MVKNTRKRAFPAIFFREIETRGGPGIDAYIGSRLCAAYGSRTSIALNQTQSGRCVDSGVATGWQVPQSLWVFGSVEIRRISLGVEVRGGARRFQNEPVFLNHAVFSTAWTLCGTVPPSNPNPNPRV